MRVLPKILLSAILCGTFMYVCAQSYLLPDNQVLIAKANVSARGTSSAKLPYSPAEPYKAAVSEALHPKIAGPVANDDVALGLEDSQTVLNVVANDTDDLGLLLPATIDLDPSTGGIQSSLTTTEGTFTSDLLLGNITFTPIADFNGVAAATYTISDDLLQTSNEATITITVANVNDPPVAVDDATSTSEDVMVAYNVLPNDDDIDDGIDPITVDLNQTLAGIQNTYSDGTGIFTVNSSGLVSYTPALNYSGSASVDYTVRDNSDAESNVATLTITVTPVNDPPVANNDSATTNEDTPITFSVTANDTDVEGAVNTATVDFDVSTSGIQTTFSNGQGSYSVSSGNVTYTPLLNFSGTATLKYTVNDSGGVTSNEATITITVNAVNDLPVANDDAASTNEDTPVSFNVTTNDADVEGAVNAATVDLDVSLGGIQSTKTTADGSYSVNGSGLVTFTPNTNFNGITTVKYTVNDGAGATSNQATITVTVNAINDPPTANDDVTTTNEDTFVTINVTTNDTDDGSINAATVDLDVATGGIQNSKATSDGTFSVNSSGVVTYTPAVNFNGSTSIDYTVNDNVGATSNQATLTINVTSVNDSPVAVADATSTNENSAVTINVVTNDSDIDGSVVASTVDLDPSTAGQQTTRSTAQGSYAVNASGVVTYTPALNFVGSTSITYTVNDNGGATSNAVTISITVNAVNQPPVAADDATSTNEDTSISFNVTTNDTDSDGSIDKNSVDLDVVTAGIQSSFTNANGSFTVNGSGLVTYTPTANFNGTETVKYTVNDNDGATSNQATLTITVNAVNDLPVAVADATSTNEDTPVSLNVVTNDTDVDGTINAATVDLDPSTAGIQTTRSTALGNYSVSVAGVVSFTPAANVSGSAVITYTVNDNSGGTSNATNITITIISVNDPPVASNDATATNEDVNVSFNVTTNDTDIDGSINTASVDLDPSTAGIQSTLTSSDGSFSVNSGGVVTYTPALNFNGSTSITYTVNDNGGATSNQATFTISVTPVNDTPVAVADATTTNENNAVSLNVVSNDSDVDGSIVASSVDLDPSTAGQQTTRSTAQGSYAVNASGVVTFTPTLNFSGSASITYTINDNGGATSNAATISITVNFVNQTPVAVDDATTTNEDTGISFNVTTNDTDSDGTINAATVDLDPATAGIQNSFSGANGSFSVNATGVVTYTPTANFFGTTTVKYTVNDNGGATSNQATLTITVNSVNDLPVAVADATSTSEDTPVSLNVTTNDTDVDGTVNAATVDLDPSTGGIQTTRTTVQGTYSVNATGLVTYTPTANFNGSAVITYTVNDNGGGTSNAANITITVTPVNDSPLANNDVATTNEDVAVALNVTTNDTDDGSINAATVDLDPSTLGIQTTFSSSDGTFSVNNAGLVTYTPALNFNGSTSINYTVNDNSGAVSNQATFTINVTPVNDPPVAVSDAATTNENSAISFNVVSNDTDVDGSVVASTVDLDPSTGGQQTTRTTAQGSYSVNTSGVVTYTPAVNFNGNASITYTVNDNGGAGSNAATISITVNFVNQTPVAVDDATSTNEDNSVSINVTTNDTDSDGTIDKATVDLDPLTSGTQNAFSGANGAFSVNATGVVTFTPNANFFGTATVKYTVDDNGGLTSNQATLTITVNSVNDLPIAAADATSTNEDTPVTVNVVANDSDVDGTINVATVDLDPSTAGIQTTRSTAQGAYSVSATGVVSYTPTNNFNGSAVITYTVNDNAGGTSNAANITITVLSLNDAPVANNDAITTNEDVAIAFNVTSNDTDVDGTINAATVDLDPTTSGIQSTFSSSDGSFSVNSGGVVTYIPSLNFNGAASVDYTVNDNSGATSNQATFTVTVTPVNDPPVAVADVTSTNENTAVLISVIANDSDVDGSIVPSTVDLDPSTAGLQTTRTTAQGTYSVSSLGVVTFTPTTNYSGIATITYTVNDNNGATSNAAAISIAVNTVIIPPVAVDDATTTNEDTPVSFNVTTNDTDSDGSVDKSTVDLDVSTVGIQNTFIGVHGNYTVNATGLVTYTPTSNFFGTATVKYTVNDNDGATSNQATLSVTVNSVNDLPVAVADVTSTTEDTPVSLNVTTNDTDVDGTINTGSVDLDPGTAGIQNTRTTAQGSYSVNASGVVTFTPASNVSGAAVISYTVNDNAGGTSNAANITVTVISVNDPPVANNDAASTNEDAVVTFNVTTNDTDSDGTISVATVDLDPSTAGQQTTRSTAQGSFSVNASGVVTYTPALNFNGSAVVNYTVNDNSGGTSNIAQLTITVAPVNDAPTSNGLPTVNLQEDNLTPQTTNLLNGFADVEDATSTFTYSIVSNTNAGFFQNFAIDQPAGQLQFTLKPNVFGTAVVTIKMTDTGGLSVQDVLTINVNAVNDPPSFDPIADVVILEDAATQTVTLTNISSGPLESQTLLLTATSGNTGLVPNPTVTYNGTGTTATLTFKPVAAQTGSADITVKVVDPGLLEFTQVFTVTVNPINDPPTLDPIANVDILEDATQQSIGLTGITAGPSENQILTVTVSSSNPALFGVLTTTYTTPQTTGTVNLKPALNAFGTATVTVTVTDDGPSTPPPNKNSITRTFAVNVQAVNDAPVATDDAVTTNEDVVATLNVVTNDTDVDGSVNAASVDLNTATAGIQNSITTAQGTFSVNASGLVTFTPLANFNGTADLDYTVNDNAGLTSAPATITVTVTPVNDPPTLDPLNNVVMQEDAVQLTIPLSGISAGPGESQMLSATVTSSDPTLFDVLSISYTSPQATGSIALHPALNENGTATITVTITDNGTGTNSFIRKFTVNVQSVNDLPAFTSTPVTVAVVGELYEYVIQVSDVENDPMTITASAKPAWATLIGMGNGKAKLSGTPPTATAPVNVTIQVKDAGSPVLQAYQLLIDTRPTSGLVSLSTNEDANLPFANSKFTGSFTDADGNALSRIQVTQLPKHGQLQYKSKPAIVSLQVPIDSINFISYLPLANYDGKDTLMWKGSDGIVFSKDPAVVAMVVVPVNDPPVLTISSDTLLYQIGIGAVPFTSLVSVADIDNDSLQHAEVGFHTQNFDLNSDILTVALKQNGVNVTDHITAQFLTSGAITLSGKAPISEYETAIGLIEYTYLLSVKPSNNYKSLYVNVSDGVAISETRDRLIDLIYTFEDIDIVTGFTPNNDKVNDEWDVIKDSRKEDLKNSKLFVYDKRGMLVFQCTGFDRPWDGKYKGEVLPADSYFYTIEIYDAKLPSLRKLYKGTVTLLR